MQYLLFTLAAPLASFGTVAVGERRPTWDRPSKSQVLGLIAGALGIERSDESGQLALTGELGFAVRVDEPGQLAVDYHTTQVPPARRKRRFATRAQELSVSKAELKTILSRREFRAGSVYTICLWRSNETGLPLVDINSALQSPTFIPFAGRKAHALMLPMSPMLIDADNVVAAFDEFDERERTERKAIGDLKWALGLRPADYRPIFADAAAIPSEWIERLEQHRDLPESRSKWRFGLRAEAMLRQSPNDGEGETL